MGEDISGICTASDFHEGRTCPSCQGALHRGDTIHLCPNCGAASHEACWRRDSGCRSYFCSRSARSGERGAASISISREDTDRLKPDQLLPPSTAYPQDREGRHPKKFSKLAIIAFLVTVISAGFLGCVSLVLGAVALGVIANNSTLRGKWLAISSVLLSVALMFGWALAFWCVPWNTGRMEHLKFRASPEALDSVPEPIRGAMRANVVVRSSGRGLLGRSVLGSGVIVSLSPERVLILTNRHVIEPGHTEGRKGPLAPAAVDVGFCTGEQAAATVRWVHPDGADLAVIECCPARIEGLAAARFRLPAQAPVGTEVFAVGNPLELEWTYTKGVISNLRQVSIGGKVIKVFQTQTPINEGNSGGGLYDTTGSLVGINTWTQSKGIAEGLSFAIAVDHAEDILRQPPAGGKSAAPSEPPASPEAAGERTGGGEEAR